MKFILISLVALGPLCAAAQGLKLSGSVGYAQPITSGVPGGFLLALEPKYGLTPTIDVGVRVEAAFLSRYVTTNGATYVTNAVKVLGSYIATGSYWLSKGRFRSFVGVGAGLYQLPATGRVTVIYNQSPDDILFPEGSRFGGMVRYGVKVGHFLGSVEYNAVLSSPVYRSATLLKSPNNYLSLKVGYEIGGSKKTEAGQAAVANRPHRGTYADRRVVPSVYLPTYYHTFFILWCIFTLFVAKAT